MNLVLFDIDGTLLRTGGAGRAAMVEAMRALHGRPDAFDDLSFAGAVDPAIVSVALRRAGVEPTPRRLSRLRSRYVQALEGEMARAVREGRSVLCPGVREAVSALEGRAQVGLMTGNWSAGARVKLERMDLWAPFAGQPGAYGDDAPDRDALMPFAWRRALRRGRAPRRVVLVGDTPSDVSAARAGARLLGPRGVEVVAVAVATGFAPREDLVASRPDLLLDNLADGLDALLGTLRPQH